MPKHYLLKVYAVEVYESISRDADFVTIEFEGELRPKTKAAIISALVKDTTLRMKKKVLA